MLLQIARSHAPSCPSMHEASTHRKSSIRTHLRCLSTTSNQMNRQVGKQGMKEAKQGWTETKVNYSSIPLLRLQIYLTSPSFSYHTSPITPTTPSSIHPSTQSTLSTP